jgi:hypothetical protein
MIVVNNINKNHLFLQTVQAPDLICPLCANRGKMEMSFYQVQLEADWVRNTRQITASAFCHQCNQDVPSIRWDGALDNFYKTEKAKIKVTTSFKTGKKGKFLIWLTIIFFSAVILLFIGLFIYNRLFSNAKSIEAKHQIELVTQAKYTASPQTGDIVQVYVAGGTKHALYKITDVDHVAKTIKAAPSGKTFPPGTEVPKETAFATTDFDTSKEKVVSLHSYENGMFNTPEGERIGNIIMIFRK